MKQIIALFAVCGFALAFVACGQKSEPAAESVETPAATEEVIESEPEVTTDTTAVDSTAVQ